MEIYRELYQISKSLSEFTNKARRLHKLMEPTKLEPGEVVKFDQKPKGIFEVSDEEYPRAMEELRELTKQPEWERRFDRTFPVVGDDSFRIVVPEMIGKQPSIPLLMYFIKDFIRQELAEQRLQDSIEPEEL